MENNSNTVETIIFAVQGSAAQPYQVKFQHHAGRVAASCTCPAGIFQDICKHRVMILNGITKGIVSDNTAAVPQVQQWIVGTEVGAALAEMTSLEAQIDQLKKDLKNVRRTIAKVMA
jgi:hypothetical protein